MAAPTSAQILTIVREALQIREDYIEGVTQAPDLIGELEKEARSYLDIMQDVADSLARWRRLWTTNGMDARIDAADPTIGGEFTIARWMELRAAFRAFEAFMMTPIEVSPGNYPAPIVVISRRGNPPAAPAAAPAPEEEPTA